jgi:LysM repeat protein
MQAVRQLGSGILYGLVSVTLIVGGLSLALAESYTTASPTPTTSLPAVPQTLTSTQAGPTALPSSTPTPTSTPPPPTNCPPPAGWILVSVQPYDTVQSVAARYRVAPSQLAQANCLLTNNLEPGFNIYVPPPPSSASISCGSPIGWARAYVVQPGDTLYHIAALYRISLSELQHANCLSTTVIMAGNILWVPNVPIFTPEAIIPSFGRPPSAFGNEAPTQIPNPNFWFFLQRIFRWRHSH